MVHARHLVPVAMAYLVFCVAPALARSIVISDGVVVAVDGRRVTPGADCAGDGQPKAEPAPPAAKTVLGDSLRFAGIRHQADSIGSLPLLGSREAWSLMVLLYSVSNNTGLSDDPNLRGSDGANHSDAYLRRVWYEESSYRWEQGIPWGTSDETSESLDKLGHRLLSNAAELNGGETPTWRGLARVLSRIGLPGGPSKEELRYKSQHDIIENWYKPDSSKTAVALGEAYYLDSKLGTGLRESRVGKAMVLAYSLSRLDKLNGGNGRFTFWVLGFLYSPLFLLFAFYAMRRSNMLCNDKRGKVWSVIGYTLLFTAFCTALAPALAVLISNLR